MRGNRKSGGPSSPANGSIPAHAGEPTSVTCRSAVASVYPRACGGTAALKGTTMAVVGLSPRMRGNPMRDRDRAVRGGSIPAHAGEPRTENRCWQQTGVYPRACGGTIAAQSQSPQVPGLSPRMRGNLSRDLGLADRIGSIPAHAGEPARQSVPSSLLGVYPRACGGTRATRNSGVSSSGLSPRMRGNHVTDSPLVADDGSIPAHAGEPLVANLLILVVFKEQGDEGHPLISLQEQNAVRIDNLFRRLAEGFDSQVS